MVHHPANLTPPAFESVRSLSVIQIVAPRSNDPVRVLLFSASLR
jgi:hypothetical protein